MTASCLYTGTIRHRRHAHHPTAFTHGITLAYLDLDELPDLLGGRLERRAPGALRFRRPDYLGDPDRPLDDCVRELASEQLGRPFTGPVRLLTQLRSFGHAFNPVSFHYLFDPAGDRLEAVVAEVTNTPWGERHPYVVPAGPRGVDTDFAKAHHVSPFMGMEQRYRARMTSPGRELTVHIASAEEEATVFDATLRLRREELTGAAARRLTWRRPPAGLRTLALIYGHALGLRLRGVPVHPHPVGRPV